ELIVRAAKATSGKPRSGNGVGAGHSIVVVMAEACPQAAEAQRPTPPAECHDVVSLPSLGLSPAPGPPRGAKPRMGHRPGAAPAPFPRPNEWMEQTGAHQALGRHQRPQGAGCSSPVV